MQNWRQMAEKLGASVCVLENLLLAQETKSRDVVKAERSVSLQFPEDFFLIQEPHPSQNSSDMSEAVELQHSSSNTAHAHDIAKIEADKEKSGKHATVVPIVLPEWQLKLHQSIVNFKQFNCSLKPLLAILEFGLQDASGTS
jgi:hypothetical protein